jgi:formylglycine-generating enzyme required for sulfatase activity
MHGNVWEFCLDWHDNAYYQTSSSSDPRGPDGPGSADYRVRRGGDWLHGSKDLRSAARYVYNYRPQARYNVIIGFRVLLER